MPLFVRVRYFISLLTVAVLLGSGLAGCGSAPPVSQPPDSSEMSLFEHMSAEEESQAIIYLYRPSAFYSALATPWVTLNGLKTILLGNNQNTRLVVRPGYYMVQTERNDNWIDGQPDTLHFSVERGKIYYLKISLQFEWHLENLFLILCRSPRCSIGIDTSKIELVDKSIAIPELKVTNSVSPL